MDGNITGFSPTNKFSFDLQRFDGNSGNETPATPEVSEVKDASTLISKLEAGGTIKLTGNIELSEVLTISKDTTLDLNGYTIESTLSGTEGRAIKVTNGTFTLRDTSADADGKIISNSDNISSGGSTAHNTIFISGGKFIMESGTVEITNENTASRAVNAESDTAPTEESDPQVEIKGGTILGTYIGLSVGKNAKAAVTGSNTTIYAKNTLANPTSTNYGAGDAFGICVWGNSKVTVGTEGDTAGPTITAVAADNNTKAEAVAVSGNGSYTATTDHSKSTIEILSGSLSATGGVGNNLGIYNPSVDSTLTIKGGTITGGDDINGGTGVEIRAATKVEVTGGTITGTGSGSFSASPNNSGSTSKGAGIAIAQHTTVKKIDVNISGDAKVSGAVALAVTNPQTNNTDENNAIKLNVTGGEFEGTEAAVFYQDNRSELDVTDGNFKGAVVTTYEEKGTTVDNKKFVISTDSGATDAATVSSGGEGSTTTISTKVKIAGGTYNSESVKKYTTSNGNSDSTLVKNGDGTYGVANKGAGWQVRDSSTNLNFDYIVSAGGSGASLLSATVSSALTGTASIGYFKSDSLNRVLGVLDNTSSVTSSSFSSGVNDSLTAKYSWLKFKTGSASDVTITPQVAGVKIIGTDIIGTATKLTVESLTGADTSVAAVTVSGADNSLSSIFSNQGDDSIVAGARATTIDGGDGADIIRGSAYADSLKGGGGNDVFYYSGGADTIADFGGSDGNEQDQVYLDGLTPITDGTKITSNTNSFTLNFGKGNTLTFQKLETATDLPTVSIASSQHYVYTKDWVMEEGKSVTLASAVKEYTISDQVMTVDGSAAAGNLTITDHAQDNNNYVTFGGEGKNTFNYKSGNDVILGYNYDNGDGDVVSLASNELKAPIDFTNATYDGSNFVLKLDPNSASKTLTFKGAANVALLQTSGNETDTYTYKAIAANKLYSIAQEGKGISLGAGYTSTQYNGTSTEYATIDAANVTQAIRIRGNDKANYIVGGSSGGVLEGNDEGDTLNGSGATDSLTLNGGAGNDLLEGGRGYNYFIYSEGKDAISGYHDTDIINVTGREVSFADVTVDTAVTNNNDLLIKFDNDNQLSIAGGASAGAPVISITSGRNNYAVKKDYIALNGKSITLAAGYGVNGTSADNRVFNGAADANTVYAAINAAAVTAPGGISIVGNDNNNYIIGSESKSNSLNGGKGDDTLVGVTVPSEADLFYYTAGKDVIENFGASTDKLAIEDTQVAGISSGKLTNSKLTFTVDKNNSLTFKFGDNDPFGKVSLQSNAYLTKDGVVSVTGTASSLKLFASAKGKIDLNDELYSLSSAAIATVDAEKVKSQSVTLVGGTQGGLFAYMENNKQRDGFEYSGGNVTISGYEGGRDRIDLGEDSLSSFEVGTGTDTGIKLILGENKTISIAGAKGQEVLLRDPTKGNGYKKMVFAAPGIVQNKKSNPTMATVSAGVNKYSFDDDASTVKKIYVTDAETGASIRAGDKYNTIIDASKATNEVSLSGGAKNDKLIGSTVDAADLFVYTGGKDVIQNFGGSDQISLATDFKASLETGKVKITAAKKSIKFKFGNKDVLTIKSNETMDGALKINDDNNIYFKNAIGDSNGSVSLTSGFSGTFRTQDTKRTALPTAKVVNGSKVEKNLTFVGSSANETLIGGDKSNKKTMFKGGGGADSLVGGDSKDTFFYAKGNTGDATIAKFDFANDKIKVSSGIISKIEKTNSAIKFSMTNGKSTDAAIGSFNITSGINKNSEVTNFSKIAIKANNTYYWFTETDDTTKYYSASTGKEIGADTLITTENRLKSAPSGYAVIDLNYSTNLAKNDIVAVKATTTKPTTTTT